MSLGPGAKAVYLCRIRIDRSKSSFENVAGHARDVHVPDEVQQVSARRALVQVSGREHQLRRQEDDLLQQKVGIRSLRRQYHPRLSGVCHFSEQKVFL